MEKHTEIRIVFATTSTFDNAQQIARILINEKLAACCSIIQNVFSIFGWQGTLNERNEFLTIIKTSENKLAELESRITELSFDEVPEIISLPVDSVAGPYLSWLLESIKND